MPNWGVSFVPGAQDEGQSQGGGRPGGPRNPVQEAIQILSLRLPRVYGATSLAPAPLLNAAGGMGQPGAKGNVTAQALAQMAGLPPGVGQPAMEHQPASPWMEHQPTPPAPTIPTPSPLAPAWGGAARIPMPDAPYPQPQDRGIDERVQAPQMPTWGGPQQPSWTPPPPRVYPGQDTGEGSGPPASPPVFSTPQPRAEYAPDFNIGFGQGQYGGQENQQDPNTWLSPWERLYGRYPG